MQGDGDALAGLVAPGSVDLVLCHAVLEVVDDPAGVVAALAAALRPGGAASVLVADRAAAVLARAIDGHLDVAAALLADPDGRAGPRDTLRRRYDADGAAALLRRGRARRSRRSTAYGCSPTCVPGRGRRGRPPGRAGDLELAAGRPVRRTGTSPPSCTSSPGARSLA